MKKFFIVYVSFLVLIQVLFTLETLGPLSDGLSLLLASASHLLIAVVDGDVIQQGLVLRHGSTGAGIRVDEACNALELLLLLYGAILAFPASLTHKLAGLAAGLVAVQLINLLRIISLFYLAKLSPAFFEWSHLYLWRFVIIVDVLLCFTAWLFYVHARSGAREAAA